MLNSNFLRQNIEIKKKLLFRAWVRLRGRIKGSFRVRVRVRVSVRFRASEILPFFKFSLTKSAFRAIILSFFSFLVIYFHSYKKNKKKYNTDSPYVFYLLSQHRFNQAFILILFY